MERPLTPNPTPHPFTHLLLCRSQVLECLHLNSRVESVTTLSNSGASNGTHSPPAPGSTRAGLPPVSKRREWLGLPAPVVTTAGVSISLRDDAASGERGVGTARGEDGVIHADAAVVTVPLPLLQQGVIRFDPPLSEVRLSLVFSALASFFSFFCCCLVSSLFAMVRFYFLFKRARIFSNCLLELLRALSPWIRAVFTCFITRATLK